MPLDATLCYHYFDVLRFAQYQKQSGPPSSAVSDSFNTFVVLIGMSVEERRKCQRGRGAYQPSPPPVENEVKWLFVFSGNSHDFCLLYRRPTVLWNQLAPAAPLSARCR